FKLEGRRSSGEPGLTRSHGGQPLSHANGGRKVLVEPFFHLGLVIEQLHLRWSANHVQVDSALGLGGEMRQRGQAACSRLRYRGRAERSLPDQRGQHDAPEPARATPEELAACFVQNGLVGWMQKGLLIYSGPHLFRTSSRFMSSFATIVKAANSG